MGAQIKVMYALYSKGFAKKATDLNKNDFKEENQTFKLTTKAKSADKVAFEGNVSDNAKKADKIADMKFTVPVDDSFSASIKTTSGKETIASCEFKFDANLKLTAEITDFKLPDVMGTKKMVGTAEYVTESFSVEAKACKGAGGSGAMAALAFDCPGLEVVRVGVQPALVLNDKNMNLNLGFAHEDKDYQLAATMGTCNLIQGEKALTGCSVRGWFKVSDSVSVAAEFDHVAKMKAGREVWDKAGNAGDDEGNTFKFGVEYKINPSTTSKVKVTSSGAEPAFDVSLKTALEGKSNAVVCVKLQNDKPQFGLNYTLEA